MVISAHLPSFHAASQVLNSDQMQPIIKLLNAAAIRTKGTVNTSFLYDSTVLGPPRL